MWITVCGLKTQIFNIIKISLYFHHPLLLDDDYDDDYDYNENTRQLFNTAVDYFRVILVTTTYFHNIRFSTVL
jgi:hypothetical protein